MEVEQYACFYPEDEGLVPDYFIKTDPLEDEIGNYKEFNIKRKLPLFQEILQRAYDASDCDYLIQTNADIGLMPFFYELVARIIEDGTDAFCINKRIIPEAEAFKDVSGLPLIYSWFGGNHAGHDCFVFKRDRFPIMNLGLTCMGTPWSEAPLMAYLVAYSRDFNVFKNAHATFHIGDRRVWLPNDYNDYRIVNTNQFAKTLRRIMKTRKKKFLKHPSMEYLLFKLRHEVKNYGWETYCKEAMWFVENGYGKNI